MIRAAAPRIVVPGRNAWCVEHADRFHAIQDGDYFRLFRDALLRATRTVFVLGWDITGSIDLLPGTDVSDGAPTRLDRLIAYVARRRPGLRCYILIWDYALLYTLERDPFSRWRFGWRMPRNVRFGFDDSHPVGASHHQKVVVIDDCLAFCGGMDLTGHRWDTPAHRPNEPGRMTPVGKPYEPYHEVQAMVDGRVAARLGALARDRWRALGVEKMPPVAPRADSVWPADATPDLTSVEVAIARTMPGTAGAPGVRECEALFLDAIAAARRTIYIENQYFTSMRLAEALASRLAEPDGPEIVIVLPRAGDGWLERNTIEVFREQALRRLRAADRHDRLRVACPMASRAADLATFVHSKVMIVDDTFVRIGSANANERSLGVDTECDLAVDAADDDACAGIRRIRDRLLADQLGLTADEVANALSGTGCLRALIDSHSDADHTLVSIEPAAGPAPDPPEAVRNAVDPHEPIGFGPAFDSFVPPLDPSLGPRPMRIWLVPAAVIVLAIAIASVWSGSFGPAELDGITGAIEAARTTPGSAWIGVAIFLVAGFVLIPLEALVVLAGVVFGGWRGTGVALTGSLAAAAIGYAAGRAIGPAAIGRWMSRRSYQAGRQLGARGAAGVAVLHVAAGASAGAVHLLCGAARVPLWSYLAGTIASIGPVTFVLSAFGSQIGSTLLQPTVWNALGTVAFGAGLALAASAVRTFLLIRQFAPSLSRHLARAEFG